MMSTLLLLVNLWVHPFHVSVADIKYKEDQKAIQISLRIFLDDLELALQTYSGDQKLDITEEGRWEFVNNNLKEYLLERVKLWDEKDKEYELTYIGAEIEDEVMWCYLEVEKVKKLERVKFSNTALFEVWADQENLAHFRAFDYVKSARLYKGEDSAVFEWE